METDATTTQESSDRSAWVVERLRDGKGLAKGHWLCWTVGPRPLLTQSLFPGDR